MIRYLFDTNVISELVRPQPHRDVVERYEEHASEGALPSVVWHELWYGVERLAPGRRRDQLALYMVNVIQRSLPVIPYDGPAAAWHAGQRARLESRGRPAPLVDSMIASVAATRDLILVTRNTDDFADFDDLHVQNWFDG